MDRVVARRSDSDYQPLLPLGSGGMGTAWLCRGVGAGDFERLVVVKRPHPHVAERKDTMLRFMEEARLTGSLHHANIVGTHQVGEDAGGPFIVLEYVEGASLDALVERAKQRAEQVPVPIALRITLDALSGLHAVHTAQDHDGRPLNILHRDISLQNLLVGVDGVCRVADFGAAKSDARKYSTDQRYLLGKLLYLPPEYLRRDQVGPTLDIYSLGITLWQTLSGIEPWEGESEAQVVMHIIEGQVPPLSMHVTIPPALDAMVAKATHHDPSLRFPSAESMAREIETLGRETGWLATHSEVARWVKELMAEELEQRRRRLQELRQHPPRTAEHEAETLAPPAAARGRRRGWVLWTTPVAVAGIATSWFSLGGQSDAPDVDQPATSNATAPATPAASGPPPRAVSAPTGRALPREPSVAEVLPATERPAPSASASSAGTSPAPWQRPRKASSVRQPTTAPDTLTRKNPYR